MARWIEFETAAERELKIGVIAKSQKSIYHVIPTKGRNLAYSYGYKFSP